jgi:chromate transporter
MEKVKKSLILFLTFFKIGLFTFGGGYAMLPMIEREIVENRGWATSEEILDYFAVAQCTPGVIAVNTATFVGKKQKGVVGGIIATLGVVFIPLIIISVIASFLKSVAHFEAVKNALWGISIAVCATITASFYKMAKKAIKDIAGIVIFIIAFFVSIFVDVSPVIVVLLAALAGIIIKNTGK